MPRIAREKLESKYFHVMVQGIAKDYIFLKNEYKEKYIEFINKYKNKFNIKVFAYCIMENHAHFLLFIKDVNDMSSFMHKINTLYAMFYNKELNNRVGHVFRNRFKSEEITNNAYLSNCIKYIHNNPIKAGIVKNPKEYKYSSYNDYFYKKGITLDKNLRRMVNLDYIIGNLDSDSIQYFMDIEKDTQVIINKILSMKDKEKLSKEEKIKIIEKLKVMYKIPYKESCKILQIRDRNFRRMKKRMSVLTNVPKTDKGGKDGI